MSIFHFYNLEDRTTSYSLSPLSVLNNTLSGLLAAALPAQNGQWTSTEVCLRGE